MAETDEKLDAILLMQAEILGRLEAMDASRDQVPGEDPRITALRDLEASIAYEHESIPPLRAQLDALTSALAHCGRSSS